MILSFNSNRYYGRGGTKVTKPSRIPAPAPKLVRKSEVYIVYMCVHWILFLSIWSFLHFSKHVVVRMFISHPPHSLCALNNLNDEFVGFGYEIVSV